MKELDDRRRREGITADAMLKRSRVSSSTHAAWRAGGPATTTKIEACHKALDEIVAEREAARGTPPPPFAWSSHSGEDYSVVMRPNETTDSASIRVESEDREVLADIVAAALNAFGSKPAEAAS